MAAAVPPEGAPVVAADAAATVLEKLIAPPLVPDAAWFAAASAGLLRAAALAPGLVRAPLPCRVPALSECVFCARARARAAACVPWPRVRTQTGFVASHTPPQVLTRPDQHRECAMLAQCLQGGTFRSQSAVLEFLAACIGHPLSPGEYGGSQAAPALPHIPQALRLLVSDEGRPILSAALALCREQPKAAALDQASSGSAQVVWQDGGLGEWVKQGTGRIASTPGDLGADWGVRGDDASAFVQQKCCDDPTDCEEPAVRERALRFLACLATRASPPSAVPPAGASSATEGIRGSGGDGTSQGATAGAEAHELWAVCTAQGIIKDVLAAFTVSSAMVAAAAGEALGRLLMIDPPPDGWRLCRKFVAKHLRTLGPLLADLSLEACILGPASTCTPTVTGPMPSLTEPLPSSSGDEPTFQQTAGASGGGGKGSERGGAGCIMGAMMRRVLSLHKEELPRECCLQANSVRVALALLLRSLLCSAQVPTQSPRVAITDSHTSAAPAL